MCEATISIVVQQRTFNQNVMIEIIKLILTLTLLITLIVIADITGTNLLDLPNLVVGKALVLMNFPSMPYYIIKTRLARLWIQKLNYLTKSS